jgi:hypothetical protein
MGADWLWFTGVGLVAQPAFPFVGADSEEQKPESRVTHYKNGQQNHFQIDMLKKRAHPDSLPNNITIGR